MPTYVYACTECDHRFEAQQAFSDDALTECPNCGGKLRKVFNSVGIVFKGSGFYRTDSRSKSESGASSSPTSDTSPKDTSSKNPSSTSSDSGGSSSGRSDSSSSKTSSGSSGSTTNSAPSKSSSTSAA